MINSTNNKEEVPICAICLDPFNPTSGTVSCDNKTSHIFHRHCTKRYAATIQMDIDVSCPICRDWNLIDIKGSKITRLQAMSFGNTRVTIERGERPGARFPGEGSFTVIDFPQWELGNEPMIRRRAPYQQRSMDAMIERLLRSSAEERLERNENGVIARVYTFGLQIADAILDILIGIAKKALGV